MEEQDINNIDYGYIKEVISTIPNEHVRQKDEDTGKVETLVLQDVVDMSYDATIQELVFAADCKFYDQSHQQIFDKNVFESLVSKTSETNRLQEKNVLLTSSFWMDVVTAPKKNITTGYRLRTIDNDNKRINYSDLSAIPTSRRSIMLPVLTTIQFDFEENPDKTINPEDIVFKERESWHRLFSKYARRSDVDAICDTAENAMDFSIHKYYLPGAVDKVEDSTLLIRYDHCSLKHKNGSMPKLYKEVYPTAVNEPHFHFNSGFGGIYKLTNDNAQHNFGVGYAISVTGLKTYLEKLYTGNYESASERRLYTENDFGMPFLRIFSDGGAKKISGILSNLKALQYAIEKEDKSAELFIAMRIMDKCTNTSGRNLEYEGGIDKNHGPDNHGPVM